MLSPGLRYFSFYRPCATCSFVPLFLHRPLDAISTCIYSLFCLLIAPVRYSGLSFIPPTQAPLRCSYRLFWVHHDTHDPSTRQRFNLRPFVHRLYNLQAPAPLSLKGGLQRRMTSPAGCLSIVCLGEHQIAGIPLINHSSQPC